MLANDAPGSEDPGPTTHPPSEGGTVTETPASGAPMPRFIDLVEAPNSRTRVEPIRRLRAVATLLAAARAPAGAVGFIRWLGAHPRGELVRAAAGLADIGYESLADRVRGILPAASEADVWQHLLLMDNNALAQRKHVGLLIEDGAPTLRAALEAYVAGHPELRPDAASPEIPTLPAGRRRWRVPAVSVGGLAGVITVVEDVAALLGHTPSRTQQRLEDRVRGEGHPDLIFDWGEPLQCAQAIAAEHDSEPPHGALPGDLVLRPVTPPTQAMVEAIASMLPEDGPRRVVRKDGLLTLIDTRAAAFDVRLATIGSVRRPLTRSDRVALRVRDLLIAFSAGGLSGWLVDQRPVLRQGLQALEICGLEDAARLGRRVLTRLGGDAVPEELDWDARVRDLSSLGRARFDLFELAFRRHLRIARFRLFDYLGQNGWTE